MNVYQIAALLLISASTFVPFANAFRPSATANAPIVPTFDLTIEGDNQSQPIQIRQVAEANSVGISLNQATAIPRKFKYDLGLGKNKPVTKQRVGETPSGDNDFDPTQFLIEHESIRSFPSPLDFESESHSSSTSNSKNKRKNLPKVQHRRHSEDVLYIQDAHSSRNPMDDCNDGNSFYPVILPINKFSAGSSVSVQKLDINTIWVEMMLHDEQKKFSRSN